MKRMIARFTLALTVLSVTNTSSARLSRSFWDIPQGHPAYEAVEYLRSHQIIQGYDDRTFRPDEKINRAEALKMIISPLAEQEVLDTFEDSSFEVVPDDAWYMPYVEIARFNNVIDGPPDKTNFNGSNTVIAAEFLKMIELANKIDPSTYLGDLNFPLSTDVANTEEWFYPYMRYAIGSSMIMINPDGLLHPEKQLTRGNAAQMMYRFMRYQDGQRTEELIEVSEQDMIITISMFDNNNITQAQYSANRALVATRGALAKDETNQSKGSVKIAEAFLELVEGHKKGSENEYDEAVSHCGNAWNLAAKAREFSPNLLTISEQVQNIAKNLADSARELKSQQ